LSQPRFTEVVGNDFEEGGDSNKVYNTAIRMLSRREHSEAELTAKLKQKLQGVSGQILLEVVSRLKQSDLLSDVRFAEGRIRNRISQGYGPYYIRRELASKGIAAGLIDRQLDIAEPDWLQIAKDLVDRRHNGVADDGEVWARAVRFLQRRGFSGDHVAKAVGQQPWQDR
jgi:regulatory protein